MLRFGSLNKKKYSEKLINEIENLNKQLILFENTSIKKHIKTNIKLIPNLSFSFHSLLSFFVPFLKN